MRNINKEIIFGFLIVVLVGGLIFFQFKNSQKITEKSVKTNFSQKNESKNYSFEEISKHSSRNDCWMVIEGKVYDVTSYIDNHPGGLIIARFCGKDATSGFNQRGRKKEPHSPKAREILKNYYIGDLK